MSCHRYTEALVDHACGAEITADAAAHLQACGACRRMFDEQRHLLQDLDRELEVALAIEPSARFAAGAMARVEYSAVRSRTIAWRSAAAAAAAILILAALGSLRFVDRRPADRQEPAPPLAASPALVEDRTPSTVAPSAHTGGASRLATVRRRSERTTAFLPDRGDGVDADIVVPAERSLALERYLALVRRGALDTSALAHSDRTGVAAPADLVIAPLSVEAIVETDGENEIGPSVDRRGPSSR
jgi:hypothetical protein